MRIAYTKTEAVAMGDYTPMPAGEYIAAIVASQVRVSKANPQNNYLAIEWQIAKGPHAGRKVYQNINAWHPNETARLIGEGELNAILKALGMTSVEDSEELHAREMIVKLKIEESNGYAPKNAVVSVRSATAPVQNQTTAAAPSAPVNQAPAPTVPDATLDDDIPL